MNVKLICLFLLAAMLASAQSNTATRADSPMAAASPSPQPAPVRTNEVQSLQAHAEQVRTACIQGRRSICGKILKVLPDGLVVDSGYTNLMREPLNHSWLVTGMATASPAPSLVEGREPGSVCVGQVFLTNLPKARNGRPEPYDYVIILAYPTGEYTYHSVGTVERTVRRFSASLAAAVSCRLQAEASAPAPVSAVK